MFPMSGVGFMGRGGASGFRFLHDELSGGLAAYSGLVTKASYTGNALRSRNPLDVDFPYLNNTIDYAAINAASVVNWKNWFDQIGSNNIQDGGGFGASYTVNTQALRGSLSLASPNGAISTHTYASGWTVVFVMDVESLFNAFSYLYQLDGTGASTLMYYQSTTEFRVQIAGTRHQYLSLNNTGLKLYMATYNGSGNITGVSLYYNDVVSAQVPSLTVGTTITGTWNLSNTRMSMGAASNGAGPIGQEGWAKEFHIFNHALNLSERETLKEILEQYYTFT